MKERTAKSPSRALATSGIRRYRPRVEPPSAAVMGRLTPEEREIVLRRLSEVAECVFDPSFRRAATEPWLFGPLPVAGGDGSNPNDDSGIDLLAQARVRTVKLTAEQERFLFLRYNYNRYQVMRVLRRYQGQRLDAEGVRELLRWEKAALEARDDIVNVNVPLVLALARRSRLNGVDFQELVSDGNVTLLRAVDKFDCARGFKFSTYACRAILTGFLRLAKRASRDRATVPATFETDFERSDFIERRREQVERDYVDELKAILGENAADLTDVEQRVIRARFALDRDEPSDDARYARTLDEVGRMIGVTRERVRQIQQHALEKLREQIEKRVATG